jgi:hypothetical protein
METFRPPAFEGSPERVLGRARGVRSRDADAHF